MVNIFGSSRDKLIGLDIDDIPDKIFSKEIYRTLDGEHGHYDGLYTSYTGKKEVHIKANWISIIDDGKVLGGVGIVEDVTERKRAEEDLEEHIDRLERFNKVTVGRELRMTEMKEEVNALLKELGRKPSYPHTKYLEKEGDR